MLVGEGGMRALIKIKSLFTALPMYDNFFFNLSDQT